MEQPKPLFPAMVTKNIDEASDLKKKASELQLAAGRYQYLYQRAQQALSDISEVLGHSNIPSKELRPKLNLILETYTRDIAKVRIK